MHCVSEALLLGIHISMIQVTICTRSVQGALHSPKHTILMSRLVAMLGTGP